MHRAHLEILAPGPLSTIQDLGRHGHQHLGFAPAGPADLRCHLLANALLGNAAGEPTIEITLGGFRARAVGTLGVAVAGAEGTVLKISGEPAECNRTLLLHDGDEISVLRTRGARAYLAGAGGFDVPTFLGSAATDLSAGVGGTTGGRLTAGERISVHGQDGDVPMNRVRPEWVPRVKRELLLDCSPGPQFHIFSDTDHERFTSQTYAVTPQSDRMGMRLEGLKPLPGSGQILSEGQPEGAVQVPSGGQPIVLLAGRRTIGGYPKIAVVGTRSLWDLAQALPGIAVRFQWREVAELADESRRSLREILGASAAIAEL